MATKTAQQETKGFYKLSWLQRIGFGSGDLAQNLIYQTICMYLLFFYTDIFGLKPGHAATMFLVVRLVDVLWDPLVGTYVDKHNPRWGKYRSYLVLAGIPLTVLAILCFWDGLADSDYTLKLCYAYVISLTYKKSRSLAWMTTIKPHRGWNSVILSPEHSEPIFGYCAQNPAEADASTIFISFFRNPVQRFPNRNL